MKSLLFEDPTYLYVLCAGAFIVCFMVWRREKTRATTIALAAGPLLAGVFFLLATLVTTDREIMQRAMRQIASQIADGNTAELEDRLDDDFKYDRHGRTLNRADTIALVRKALAQFRLKKCEIKKMDITLRDGRADMKLVVVVETATFGTAIVSFTLDWVNRGGRWHILELTGPRFGVN